MNTLKIARYQLRDMFRSRWVLVYGLFFLAVTDGLFRFGGTGERVVLSLTNVVLGVVPLVAIVLGAMYLYSAREAVELLLSQPVRRGDLYRGLYLGLLIPLCSALVLGIGLPFLYHGAVFAESGFGALPLLLGVAVLLTMVFVALAFAVALSTEDRVKGLGLSLVLWMFFSVIYGGFTLLFVEAFSAYPMQRVVIVLSMLNPVDLGRILLLLNLDVSAMMGFTGAVFERFFGSGTGQAVTLGALAAWAAIPFLFGHRAFARKNF
jgi:Cu-processing system permease protein